MSVRERETLRLLTQGYSASEIAKVSNISPNYVYSMIKMLKIRFDVRTSNGIVAQAIAEGVITPEGTFREEESQSHANSAD